MKLWGGRFTKETDQLFERFHSSVRFGQRLIPDDLRGSLAHVGMLGACGIIPQADADRIAEGLHSILADAVAGRLALSEAHEDIYMNVEKILIDRIGPVGGKLHTGRSRNDQTATAKHLYLRRECKELIALLLELLEALVHAAESHIDVIAPGYTHLQRAQPILFSHHLMAYYEMFSRDVERLKDALKRIDMLPLGAAALAGTTFAIDRDRVRQELGFARMYANSMDAVSDRDFILEFHAAASILMMHLSRLCEELVLWSSTEFGFIELDDAYCTGSSIMPQKKNPDVAELVRGKTGRVYGNLMGLLTVMKGLPLTYNKDMQEDMEGMFDSVDTAKGSLAIFAGMIRTVKVRREHLAQEVRQDFSNATDLADYLVRKSLPFRQAHEAIGKLVLYCIENGKRLADLSLEEYRRFSPLFEADLYPLIDPRAVVEARNSFGGTSSEQVAASINEAKNALMRLTVWLEEALAAEDGKERTENRR